LAHPETFSQYSETNYCCCEAKWKSYFKVGRDYRFRKRCTVHGVCAIPCDWGLHGTISLWLSTCQTYCKKINVQESRLLHYGTSAFVNSQHVCWCRWCLLDHDKNQKDCM